MNTTENNRLIVEFMGLKPKMESPDVYTYSDMPFFAVRESNPEKVMEAIAKYSKYHKDWNWLMEVVQKILNISLELDSMELYYNITDSIPSIDNSYKAVVEFIKWYNLNKS